MGRNSLFASGLARLARVLLVGSVLPAGSLVLVTGAAAPASATAASRMANLPTAGFCTNTLPVVVDVDAAAAVPLASGGSLGQSGATALLDSVEGQANVCTEPQAPATARTLAQIAKLYKTDPTQAHAELVALLSSGRSPQLSRGGRVPMSRFDQRDQGQLTTPCPNLAAKISVAGATQTVKDVGAAQVAAAAGDSSGVEAALSAAQQSFAAFASTSGASTVGDYIQLLANAQLLGMDQAPRGQQSLADQLENKLKAAADAAVKASGGAKPDPCSMSPSQRHCYQQAVALDVMVGGMANIDDLSQLFACGTLWTMSMPWRIRYSPFDLVININYEANFRVQKNGSIIPAPANALTSSVGAGTGTCGMSPGPGLTAGKIKVLPSVFHTTITGKRTSSAFMLNLSSPDFTIDAVVVSGPPVCDGAPAMSNEVMAGLKAFPLRVPASATAKSVFYNYAVSSGTSIVVKMHQVIS